VSESFNSLETLFACLTPPGVGAIATIGLRGPRAWTVLRDLWQGKSPLPERPSTERVWLGRLGDEVADEAVIAVMALEPVPQVEVHSHGGREVVRLLTETLQARGLRLVAWPELERCQGGPLQAAAALVLSQARTVRTASSLLDQYQGAFVGALHSLHAAFRVPDLAAAGRLLEDLARWAPLGRHLTVPWRVIVAGAPNVGKSSLVNALAGYARCVVSPVPGTTRDLVTVTIALEGWLIELVDTAGLRTSGSALEEAGMQLARAALASADLSLWVVDASVPPSWPTADLPAVHMVINKFDLPPAWPLETQPDAQRVSARTGDGIAGLGSALARWLVPEPPPAGAAIPFTPVLGDRIEEAWRCFCAGDAASAARVIDGLLAADANAGVL